MALKLVEQMWESWQTCPWVRGAAVVAAYADLIDVAVAVAVVAAKGLRVEKQPWLPLLVGEV